MSVLGKLSVLLEELVTADLDSRDEVLTPAARRKAAGLRQVLLGELHDQLDDFVEALANAEPEDVVSESLRTQNDDQLARLLLVRRLPLSEGAAAALLDHELGAALYRAFT